MVRKYNKSDLNSIKDHRRRPKKKERPEELSAEKNKIESENLYSKIKNITFTLRIN